MNTYDILFSKDNSNEINKVIDCYFLDGEDQPATYFPKFNKINIIVGANNSGKSMFMRHLMSYENLEGVHDLNEISKLFIDYNFQVDSINLIIQNRSNDFKTRSIMYYDSSGNSDEIIYKKLIQNRLVKLNLYSSFLSTIQENKNCIFNILNAVGNVNDVIENKFLSNYNSINEEFYKYFEKIKRYYIPTLRTAHSLFNNGLEKIENDIFLATLYKYYNLDKIDVEVFTGIHLYKDILNTRNSKREIRKQFENFEEFISKSFFNGKRIDIVAEFDKDKSLNNNNESEIISVHIEGENETRKLYELGDGIQAIIILMYKIFMSETNSFIFIDEPEINLHPGMQRLFLEQICSNSDLKKKNLTFIISTHSNHFLDLTIEKDNVSIYSFSPKSTDNGEKQFLIKNVNSGDNQILKNLGVNNSSVFMANCSIWVEGISDRNYIKAFLKSYSEHLLKNDKKNYVNLKEDIDFAFFEYAGSNINHYIFDKELEKEDEKIILKDINSLVLNNRIFLLADSDSVKMTEKKGIRLKALEELKSPNFFPKIIWEAREIENLLTNNIWKEVLIEFCNKSLVANFSSHIQTLINEALLIINSKNYSKKYIGEFINDIRAKVDKSSKTFYINQSNYEVKSDGSFGTIKNKRELSEIIFNKNFSWEILKENKEIEKLTIEIYNFILDK